MVNYGAGRIYKLINEVTNDIYIGSTCCPLWHRMGCHRTRAKGEGPQSTTKLYQKMREIGVDFWRIVLVEQYPCESKDELTSREEYWIRELNATLNTIQPPTGLTRKEYGQQWQAGPKRKAYIKARGAIKWTCETCHLEMSIRSKGRHLKQQAHLDRVADPTLPPRPLKGTTEFAQELRRIKAEKAEQAEEPAEEVEEPAED